MAFSAHRGTVGHTIGAQVIGKDNPSGTSPKISGANPGAYGHGLKSISMDFGHNGGVSITHRLQPTGKQDSYDPRLEQTHMFRDADEAHGHIGALMGLRLASGTVKQ